MKKENIANYITSIRFVMAAIMAFTKVDSSLFLILFTIGGISDAIDGFVARKLKIESEFGKKLDSVADLSFFAVSLIMILPTLVDIVRPITWYFVGGIVVVRLYSYLIYVFKKYALASNHTIFNKATSAMFFCLPYIIRFSWAQYFCYCLVIVAIIAAVDDLIINCKAIKNQ